ncbi:MAG: hypothetical protein JEY96_01470 [Bacteroidales bacterium]|nr:hypothetical protein [Bacteroidales bacterium]
MALVQDRFLHPWNERPKGSEPTSVDENGRVTERKFYNVQDSAQFSEETEIGKWVIWYKNADETITFPDDDPGIAAYVKGDDY